MNSIDQSSSAQQNTICPTTGEICKNPQSSSYKKELLQVLLVSTLAIGFLMWLLYIKRPLPQDAQAWTKQLPLINASMNALSAICLIFGLRAIFKSKKIIKSLGQNLQLDGEEKNILKYRQLHQMMMISSFAFSAIFLIGYILYHAFHGETKFQGIGLIRPIYFFILITHVLLSFPTLPLVLLTFLLAFKKKWCAHKRFAKVTAPLWLYVSVTGVIVYLMLHVLPSF